MGFFSTLPAIWRLLQCIRRYYNSKMWFPHLVNGGKYAFTILHYMMLSIWQQNIQYEPAKAAFIACASINSIYVTVWDIAMDWSLLDPYAKHPFLRKDLGYKRVWPYYLAMFLDPLLRCNWFFYIIYAKQAQHSALLPFFLACIEVLRRFMWGFFRMENEHVGKYVRFQLPSMLIAKNKTALVPIEPIVIYHYRTSSPAELHRRLGRSSRSMSVH
jgi:hypothetical protein